MSEIPFYPDEHEPPQRGIETTTDLQALADVRTLDALWQPDSFGAYRLPVLGPPDAEGIRETFVGVGATPDAARHAAAEWVRTETLARAAIEKADRILEAHARSMKNTTPANHAPAGSFTVRDAVELIAAELNVRELITAREKAGHVTEDTPVTLGMLRDLLNEGAALTKQRYPFTPYSGSAVGDVIDQKLGGIR